VSGRDSIAIGAGGCSPGAAASGTRCGSGARGHASGAPGDVVTGGTALSSSAVVAGGSATRSGGGAASTRGRAFGAASAVGLVVFASPAFALYARRYQHWRLLWARSRR